MSETGLDIDEQLKLARAQMYEGRFEAALGSATAILQSASENIDALYMKAVCQRYLGDHEIGRAHV